MPAGVQATDCHAEGVSAPAGSNSGGFVGSSSGCVYEGCTASGTVSGPLGPGRLCGLCHHRRLPQCRRCFLYTRCAADVDVDGNDWRLGGFVGYAEYGVFANCVPTEMYQQRYNICP